MLEGGGASLAAVLDLVRTETATTRLDIERAAELGRAVVTDRLAILTKLGLVAEGELGPAIGGRAPRHIRFVAEAGVVLVAVLDRSYLGVALADLSGRLVVEHHEAIETSSGPEDVLERLTTLFIWLLDERGGKERVWGIGLALPEPPLVDAWESFSARRRRARPFAGLARLRFCRRAFAAFRRALLDAQRHTDDDDGGTRSGRRPRRLGLAFRQARSLDQRRNRLERSLHRGAQGLAGLIGHSPTGEIGGVHLSLRQPKVAWR